MLFNSYEFLLVFLPLTLFGFFKISKISHHLGALWLAVASLAFYGWWNPIHVFILIASITFNYALGYAIGHKNLTLKRPLLIFGITSNLIFLGYFKYANFFLDTINHAAGTNWLITGIVLPIGISFFTFTQIAFLVDVYRGIAKEYRFVHYLLFVTYFPHLIAGPVLHHKQMMPQFTKESIYRLNSACFATGLSIFIIGLTKKVILADNLGDFATPFFDEAKIGLVPGLGIAWLGALAYSLQLYFDFSGYSDMAIGLSLMIGVNLPINFDSPYKARNIIEFWRRWHTTLSAFLRDYLYIPLGGNKLGEKRRYFNVLTTMILGGLWHGANWTFVVWGALHGIYLCLNHIWQLISLQNGNRATALSIGLSRLLTFLAVVFAWVFFRADSIDTALLISRSMLGFSGWLGQTTPIREQMIYWVAIGLLIANFTPNTQSLFSVETPEKKRPTLSRWKTIATHPLCLGLFLALSLSRLSGKSEFLYFQF